MVAREEGVEELGEKGKGTKNYEQAVTKRSWD